MKVKFTILSKKKLLFFTGDTDTSAYKVETASRIDQLVIRLVRLICVIVFIFFLLFRLDW